MRIARLPDLLVNQIAAGEVVERPASVVKELVENSLDAGATRIEVLLAEGGIDEITVLDDGVGMAEEDLRLAVERHTTSKLRALTDLDSIGTYGFRGEALASIVSVADVELKSRTRSDPAGARFHLRYGEVVGELRPTGMPPGTAIRVRALFSQLPARQKFLRTAATEYAAAARTLRELALGNPGVAFHLHHQGRRVAHYTGTTRPERFRECLKPDWDPIEIAEDSGEARLEAYLSPPTELSDRGEVFLFVNGRPVRNRNLIAAVRNAYLQTWGPNREPSGVVYLDIRRDWVDVNVHPQKLEVRCLRHDLIYGWILSAVRKKLGMPPAPEVAATPAAKKAAHGLGTLADRYHLLEDETGLLIVDSRALRRNALKAGPVPSRALTTPKILRLAALPDGLGFAVETLSGGEVALKAVPEFLADEEIDRCLAALTHGEDPYAVLADFDPRETAVDDSHAFRISFQEIEKHFARSTS